MFALETVSKTAARLSGKAVLAVRAAQPGGNNRIFRVDAANGDVFALKFYPTQGADRRDRLGAEWEAINFMVDHGIRFVPKPLAYDVTEYCALYEWVDGHRPNADEQNVLEAARFLLNLQKLNSKPEALAIRAASAACFSARAVVDQLRERRTRLDGPSQTERDLKAFLTDELDPAISKGIDEAEKGYARNGWGFSDEMSAEARCLSPSDFGLHNALATKRGNLTFLDFEYFGWDDPVKAVSDIVLHPGSNLPAQLCQTFLAEVTPVFRRRDPGFSSRLKFLYPLFACIWCLIILNEYLPERWARRVMAGGEKNRREVQKNQLLKAHLHLSSSGKNHSIATILV